MTVFEHRFFGAFSSCSFNSFFLLRDRCLFPTVQIKSIDFICSYHIIFVSFGIAFVSLQLKEEKKAEQNKSE